MDNERRTGPLVKSEVVSMIAAVVARNSPAQGAFVFFSPSFGAKGRDVSRPVWQNEVKEQSGNLKSSSPRHAMITLLW